MGAAPKGTMTFSDYAVMIGGPIAFLLVAVLGILWVLGPAPARNPVELVKKGEVRTGMTRSQVLDLLGAPKSKVPLPDGGEAWKYHHGTSEPFVEEDADLKFDAGGALLGAVVSRTPVPIQETERRTP